ncbi:hypothetical protein [Thermosulfurimonas sp. F29]|uniref:hypothetical protein n=1 Tax=Thermosulfurimonas sp. F29 TaxID=2867247 RepID=UPI001C838F6A|nr:hypothetical protein [Thermosulfurimonas sp. F29]MBX6424228.1 hypothetical protein [Thermosulfurimonas sp. F29]
MGERSPLHVYRGRVSGGVLYIEKRTEMLEAYVIKGSFLPHEEGFLLLWDGGDLIWRPLAPGERFHTVRSLNEATQVVTVPLDRLLADERVVASVRAMMQTAEEAFEEEDARSE